MVWKREQANFSENITTIMNLSSLTSIFPTTNTTTNNEQQVDPNHEHLDVKILINKSIKTILKVTIIFTTYRNIVTTIRRSCEINPLIKAK